MVCQRHAKKVIREHVVQMYVKHHVFKALLFTEATTQVRVMPLENRKNDFHRFWHSSSTNGTVRRTVEAAQSRQRNVARWFINDADASQRCSVLVPRRHLMQHIHIGFESPVVGTPICAAPACGLMIALAANRTVVTQDDTQPRLLGPKKSIIERIEVRSEVGFAWEGALHQPVAERYPNGVHTQITDLNEVALRDVSGSVLTHQMIGFGRPVLLSELPAECPLVRWYPFHHLNNRRLVTRSWFPDKPSTKVHSSPSFLGCSCRRLQRINGDLRPNVSQASLQFLGPPHAPRSPNGVGERLPVRCGIRGMRAQSAELLHE
mmetsp:Transcript_33873/g.90353  ORF Transcript_33873/g.90353 Transcript_33873/m.90353 type:complete len:320 (+) Transcript_33873:160-1119(+)